ncbi:hypothetical protein LINPERHAP1_LOCUS1478 [Linum perenne]
MVFKPFNSHPSSKRNFATHGLNQLLSVSSGRALDTRSCVTASDPCGSHKATCKLLTWIWIATL